MIIKKYNKTAPEVEKQVTETEVPKPQPEKVEEIDLFSLDNIDFSQRQERRRGDRRRGYRRIDDRNLISRAQEEAETIKDSAAKEGYKRGIEDAQVDLGEFRNSVKQFLNAPQEVFDYIAGDILEISVDIAQKIIKKEISQDPTIILNTIIDVLKTVPKEETKVVIKVNSTQQEFVKANMPEILSTTGLDTKIHVVADDTVEEGGCIFTTSNGIVDATIRTQTEIIKEALKGI